MSDSLKLDWKEKQDPYYENVYEAEFNVGLDIPILVLFFRIVRICEDGDYELRLAAAFEGFPKVKLFEELYDDLPTALNAADEKLIEHLKIIEDTAVSILKDRGIL